MDIEKIFTIYWSQVTLLLVGLGYFIKRIFDNISKKREINHSLFQQKKLESTNSFFTIYAESKQMWIHIKIHQILRNEFSASEIDEMIFPLLNKLNEKVIELQIYFDKEIHGKFTEILKNMESINNKLSELYFDSDKNLSKTQRSNEFYFYKDKKLALNDNILKEIAKNLKKTFQ